MLLERNVSSYVSVPEAFFSISNRKFLIGRLTDIKHFSITVKGGIIYTVDMLTTLIFNILEHFDHMLPTSTLLFTCKKHTKLYH